MTLQRLYDSIGAQLKISPRRGEDEVCIEVWGSSFGGTPVVKVKSAGCGIDWNDGVFIMEPEETLTSIKDDTIIKEQRSE